jgi:hypothetical protein
MHVPGHRRPFSNAQEEYGTAVITFSSFDDKSVRTPVRFASIPSVQSIEIRQQGLPLLAVLFCFNRRGDV